MGVLSIGRSDWQPPYFALIGAVCVLLVIAFVANASPQEKPLRPEPDQRFTSPQIAAMLERFECPPRGVCIDGHIVRVIDGDTVVVRSQIEYQIRLLDCWAPESRTKDLEEKSRGLRSKARIHEIASDRECRVFMPSTGAIAEMITLGRVLGRVWIMQDGEPAAADLSAIMVEEGLATKKKAVKP
jgi:endonuclease YncB( thermonuclease family)